MAAMAAAMLAALSVACGVLTPGSDLDDLFTDGDECQPGFGDEACHLFLRQLRGRPVVAGGEAKARVKPPSQHSHSMLQLYQQRTRTLDKCGASPSLDGEDLESLVSGTRGVLLVAMPKMACTQAALRALQARGIPYTLKEFGGEFAFTEGQSRVWDWLHCRYPEDKEGASTMHSYVFKDGRFIGQGFVAARLASSGQLDDGQAAQSCEDRFAKEAEVAKSYMRNSSSRVLLFGWINCPCVGIAQTRFAAAGVCYEGRQWAEPNSRLMTYLQCKENDSQSHSFVYFRKSSAKDSEWTFAGNGFALEDRAMSSTVLDTKVKASGAATDCHHANVKTNVFGTQLEECRVGSDPSGSWMDDGTCSEQTGGIHQVCIESLPADFSTETHQPAWSKERVGKRHCVCVGAWSLYITDASKHPEGADAIMPHCRSIPETVLTVGYLGHWKDWNGYPASVLRGIKELVQRCLSQATTDKLKCGLKERFTKLQASKEAAELKNSQELQSVAASFQALSCP